MSTINNLVSSNNFGAGALKANQEQLRELKNQYKGKEIDNAEYAEKAEQLKNERAAIVSSGINAADNNLVSNLFSYMNNDDGGRGYGVWGAGMFDSGLFFGSKGELTQLQAMNSARIGIENRARTLVGEIARDRARGYDVSDKQKALFNLTGNLDILNKNLDNSIQQALREPSGENTKVIDVIGKIRDSLETKPAEKTEETGSTGSAQATEPQKSVAEQTVETSQPKDPSEMNTAEQIAEKAKAEYAESVSGNNTVGESSGTANNVVGG